MNSFTRTALALAAAAFLTGGCGCRTFLHTEEEDTTRAIDRQPVVVPDKPTPKTRPKGTSVRTPDEVTVEHSVEKRVIERKPVP